MAVDEEALAEGLTAQHRRERGVFYTPAPLVQRVLEAVAPFVPSGGPGRVVDPACGAGAFLTAAADRFPRATLFGADLDDAAIRHCRDRLPAGRATLQAGNALTDESALPSPALTAFTLWVGNPPYNGTSPLLAEKATWRRVLSLLPEGVRLPRGTSLREDYLFFLLLASTHLQRGPGALAFVTSATLLDAFAYAPVRGALLSRMTLQRVVDLGSGAFRGTRVRTCITVWTPGAHPSGQPVPFDDDTGSRPVALAAPHLRLRPESTAARQLDSEWRTTGEPLTTLVPVSFPGLKTRFDELLVDDDADRLLRRVQEFLGTPPARLRDFHSRWALPERTWAKLETLKQASAGLVADRACVRPFLRYRGAKPAGAPAFCYLHRGLIPRGDHRLQGAYDPHAHPVKLVFNVHELPLHAQVVDAPGCVTAYQHARFAPLLVPAAVRAAVWAKAGLQTTGARVPQPEATDLVPNLSPQGVAWALALGGERAAFDAIARFVTSDEVQSGWAPDFGTSTVVPVPLRRR